MVRTKKSTTTRQSMSAGEGLKYIKVRTKKLHPCYFMDDMEGLKNPNFLEVLSELFLRDNLFCLFG